MKKFFTISFIILIILVIIYLVWFFFFKKPNQTLPFFPIKSGNTLTVGKDVSNQNNSGLINIQNQNSNNPANPDTTKPTQYLFQIWDKPTAGFSFMQTPILLEATTTNKKGQEIIIQKRATTTSLIFADRMTGHIYKKDLGAKSGDTYKVSNSTVPGIYDAYFFENGSYVLMRYFNNKKNTVESILAKVPQVYSGSTPQTLENIVSLPQNISSVSVSQSGKELSYLVPNSDGAVIYSYTIKKGKGSLVTRLNLKTREWNLVYGGENLYAESSPSAYVSGYLIKVDTNEGVISDKTGLTVLPNLKDTNYFGSMWTDSGLASFIFSRATGGITKTKRTTLSEKCVWQYSNINIICAIPNSLPTAINGLPDDWYQGRASFTDSFYLMSSNGDYDNMFLNLSNTAKKNIDAVNLQINNQNEYLGFINKKEGDFWVLFTKDIFDSVELGL